MRRRLAMRRWPWAGILAIALLLVADRAMFGLHGPWQWFVIEDPNSAAGTRLALRELSEAPPEQSRVAVVGTSSVIDGFDPRFAERRLPGAAFAKLGHPRFEPFAVRALVPDLLASGVDAVVLMASEQDTHRPLRLEPVPGASAASLGAVADLLRATDWGFAVENRTSLYRLVATSMLGLYRYRPDLLLMGLRERRRFELDERHRPTRDDDDPFRPVALWGAERNVVQEAALRSTWDLFPPLADPWNARIQSGTAQEITRGSHVPVQEALLRSAVQRLREAGVEVVVLQGAMHPAARDLYDPQARSEFREFALLLERDDGVVFVPRERMQRLAESDFYDLMHTNARGARKITRAMVRGLRRTGIEWPAARVSPP